MSKKQFWLASFGFLILVTIGIYIAFQQVSLDKSFYEYLKTLSPITILYLFICAILVYITDIFRFQIFAKMFKVKLDLSTSLQAVIVNLFFGWITPGAAMGAPSAIYILGKKGVPWDTATIICFGKSTTGFAFLLIGAFIFLALGLGPIDNNSALVPFLIFSLFIAILILAIPILGSIYPQFTLKKINSFQTKLSQNNLFSKLSFKFLDLLKNMTLRLKLLFENNLPIFLLACFYHLLYFIAFIGPTVILCLDYGAPLLKSISNSTIYTALAFASPTPGGSGISEGSSVFFFKDIVTPANALLIGLICRAFTFYFQIVIGILYFIFYGGFNAILSSKKVNHG